MDRENGGILLVNLLQSSRSTLSCGSFLSFLAFKEGMLSTPISILGGWPTVSGGFVRLGGRAKKSLPKWLIRFVTGAPRGTTLATVGVKPTVPTSRWERQSSWLNGLLDHL